MKKNAILITPNNRLSNELIHDFFRANPKLVQDKPLCLPYSAFLHSRYKTCCHQLAQKSHPIILTTAQLQYLWNQVLTSSASHAINDGLVQAVAEAWARCQLWQIDFNHASFSTTPQTRQFQLWAFELQEKLDALNALTQEQIAEYLLVSDNQGPSQTLIWACFDDYTPQQRALQSHYSTQGWEHYHFDLEDKTGDLYCYAAQDDNDEYRQLIQWLSTCLTNNKQRIGVVVPNLQTESEHLKRLLQQQFPAEEFNISLGKALAEYPLVAHALCWLQQNGKTLGNHEARLLLHSPYLAYSQSEMLPRMQLLEDCNALEELDIDLSTLIKAIKDKSPKLAEILAKMTDYPEKCSPKDWAGHFKNRLKNLGFPGEYPLNSASYQCYQRFLLLLDEFKQLSLVVTEMTREEALSALLKLAKSTIFQAKKPELNIQILGFLEASGCTFDALWITGLTDLALPKNARLSAFIPLSLQQDNLMPHASPIRELELAAKAITRFSLSSPTVIFSYPRLSLDKPNMPSPLIGHFPPYPAKILTRQEISSPLSQFSELYILPLIGDENTGGGTAILANQAKCPFRAFAAHRLHAKAGLRTSEGPDAKERGQLIHKVMELLWQALGDQQTLLTLSTSQLEQLIQSAIEQALLPIIHKRTHSFSTLVRDVEFARLKRLVHACLDWERQRPDFSVEALEQTFHIHLGGMNFKVRMDRLDKVAQDKKWVIDYKSSLPQSLPWNEDRPKEPQLLLYALLDESIAGLLFSQLKAGRLVCKGFSEENYALSGVATLKKGEHWTSYRQRWQQQLNELAEEFSQGHCTPKPANTTICQQCEFQNLCRYNLS